MANQTSSSSIFSKICISFCEFMSAFAVLFIGAQTPSSVFLPSDGFQMIWVNTKPYSAKMINVKSFWDWAFMQFIRKSVGLNYFFANSECAIFLMQSTFATFPNPARISFFDFFKKSFFQRHVFHEHSVPREYTNVKDII